MANFLGAGVMADAFFMAFRIPNFLRRIFAEGAFSQAFIPVFSELNDKDAKGARNLVASTLGILGASTLLITVLGMIFAPVVIRVLAPGFVADELKFNATVDALRIMFPYLFCISLVAMSAGVLNSNNRWAIPAITPVMLNICLILTLLFLLPFFDSLATALAYGVLGAGVFSTRGTVTKSKKGRLFGVSKI